MNESMKELVAGVRKHAEAHYEEGWDVIVEAYTDEELAEEIGQAKTVAGAIRKVGRTVSIRKERYDDIRAEAW